MSYSLVAVRNVFLRVWKSRRESPVRTVHLHHLGTFWNGTAMFESDTDVQLERAA